MSIIKSKNKVKASVGDRIYSAIIYCILFLFAVAALYPFLHVIAVSLSSSDYVSSGLVSIFPKGFHTSAYAEVLTNNRIYMGYRNTLYVTILTTVLGVICTATTAYPLSRDSLPGKSFS